MIEVSSVSNVEVDGIQTAKADNVTQQVEMVPRKQLKLRSLGNYSGPNSKDKLRLANASLMLDVWGISILNTDYRVGATCYLDERGHTLSVSLTEKDTRTLTVDHFEFPINEVRSFPITGIGVAVARGNGTYFQVILEGFAGATGTPNLSLRIISTDHLLGLKTHGKNPRPILAGTQLTELDVTKLLSENNGKL